NESIAHINKLIVKRKINPADVPAPILEALSTHSSGLKTIRSLLEAGQIKSVKDLPEVVRGNLELDFVSSFEKRINGTIDAEIKKIKERIKELEEPGRKDYDLKEKLEDARKLLEAYEYVRNKEIFEWQSRIADMETQKVPEGYESLPSVLDVLLVHGHKLAPEYVHGMLKGKAAYETVFDGKGERKIMYLDGKYLGVGGIAITQQTLVVAEGLKEPVVFASKTPKAKNDLVEKIDKLEKELAQVKEAGFAQEALQSYETRINLFKEINELYKEYSKLEYCDDATYIDYAGRLNSLYAKHVKSGAYEAYGYQPYSELFAYGREGINESHNARKILAIQANGGLDHVIQNKYVGQGRNITFMEALNHPKLDGKVVSLNELMDPQFKLDGKKKISTEQYWMYVVDLLETSGNMNDSYGLVHRDLKPENVLIAPDGKLRIIDLGSIRTKNQLESTMFPAAAPSKGAFPSLGGVTATYIDNVKSYHEAKGTKGPDGKPLAKFGFSDRFANSQIISESIDYRVAGLMPDQIIALEQVREYLKEPDASSNVAAERIRNVFENY
ncbi:hypothetical protein GF340_03925, partial [Candidatus Peregrinibacteria bacterium]|nr:hypothetical protein [Candidatus Peregrinibacteria bacterium]